MIGRSEKNPGKKEEGRKKLYTRLKEKAQQRDQK